MTSPANTISTRQKTSPDLSTADTDSIDPYAQLIAFNDTDDAKRLIAWQRHTYNKMKSARVKEERKWYGNLLMYHGQHYYSLINTQSGSRFGIPKNPKKMVRTTTNRIRPAIRTQIARLTSQKPTCSIEPASGEEEDIAAAAAGEAVWKYLARKSKFHTSKAISHAFWLTNCGTSFMKTWWDPNLVDPSIKLAVNDDPANRIEEPIPATGNVQVGVPVSPFNIFAPDLLVEEIEDQPYIFEAYAKPVSWVKANFGRIFEGVQIKTDVLARNEIFDAAYFSVGSQAQDSEPDSCLFIESWIKPGGHELFPKGGMLTTVAGKIVQMSTEGLPYEHKEYPYAKTVAIPTGNFYGESITTDLAHLQREYNKLRSQIIETRDRMSRPQIVYTEGSLEPSNWTSEAGLLIPVKPGFAPPSPMQLGEIPSYVFEDQNRILADMEDISGQHQVSRGMAPGGGVEAATAISFLQERDDSLDYTLYASLEDSVAKVARHTLSLVVTYWDMPRIVRVTGIDGVFDAHMLKGADIASAQDITCEAMSSLPDSKPARQAFLMEMAKNGFIDPNQLIDLLSIGGIGKLQERVRVDAKQARNENLRMKLIETKPELLQQYQQYLASAVENSDPIFRNPDGTMNYDLNDPGTWPPMIPVNDWDNHAAHIEVHNTYRKGDEFQSLSQTVKDQFAAHVRMHEYALQMKTQQAMMGAMPQNMPDMVAGPEAAQEQPPTGMEGGM